VRRTASITGLRRESSDGSTNAYTLYALIDNPCIPMRAEPIDLAVPSFLFMQPGASCDSHLHLGSCSASLNVSGNSVRSADANCALVQWHADVNSFSDTVTNGFLSAANLKMLPWISRGTERSELAAGARG
jgi:hypothetical protein